MDQSIYTEVHRGKGPRFQGQYYHRSYGSTRSITVDQTLNTQCPDSSVFAPTHGAPAPFYLFIQTLAVSFALGLLVYRFLNQLVPNPFSVLVLQFQNFSNVTQSKPSNRVHSTETSLPSC